MEEPANIPPEELVPEDDRIVGTAFRWSAGAILAIAAVVVAVVFLRREKPAEELVKEKDLSTIPDLVARTESAPEVTFRDVTVESGIDFVHCSGARGEKLLPETMGSGLACFDADGDGDQDVLFVNGCAWPGDPEPTPAPTLHLYRNDGKGRFEDVTAAAGLAATFYGMGATAADFDGDGHVDLFVTAVGPNHLYRNLGDGRFEDVTAQAGVAGDAAAWSTGAGFFDADQDGDLDLLVGNYVKWSREIDLDLAFTMNGKDRAYGPPTQYGGSHPVLYRNDGGGRFTDVSENAGIQIKNKATGVPVAKTLGFSFCDIDHDGRTDVLVANDTVQNFLLHGLGDCRFQEIGVDAGMAYDSTGNATGAMGIDCAYFRNDACLGVGIGNFANEMTSLYVSSHEPLQFSDEAIGEGVGSPSRIHLSFGLFFFDYDLDGRLDLLQANGHLEETIHEIQASQHYQQPAQLFWNRGFEADSCFVEIPAAELGDLATPIAGRSAAYADLDGDGDLDVVLTQPGGRPLLLRNEQSLGHHFLRLQLEGRAPNTGAIGARVRVTQRGRTFERLVQPCRSYLASAELPVTLGLGTDTAVEKLEIVWPNGDVQPVTAPVLDGVTVIRQ